MYGVFILEYESKIDPDLNTGVQIKINSLADYKNGEDHGNEVFFKNIKIKELERYA